MAFRKVDQSLDLDPFSTHRAFYFRSFRYSESPKRQGNTAGNTSMRDQGTFDRDKRQSQEAAPEKTEFDLVLKEVSEGSA